MSLGLNTQKGTPDAEAALVQRPYAAGRRGRLRTPGVPRVASSGHSSGVALSLLRIRPGFIRGPWGRTWGAVHG